MIWLDGGKEESEGVKRRREERERVEGGREAGREGRWHQSVFLLVCTSLPVQLCSPLEASWGFQVRDLCSRGPVLPSRIKNDPRPGVAWGLDSRKQPF